MVCHQSFSSSPPTQGDLLVFTIPRYIVSVALSSIYIDSSTIYFCLAPQSFTTHNYQKITENFVIYIQRLVHWREGPTPLPPMGLRKSEPGGTAGEARVLDRHSLKEESSPSGLRAVDAILRDAQRLLRTLHCIRRQRPVDAVDGQVLLAAEVQ